MSIEPVGTEIGSEAIRITVAVDDSERAVLERAREVYGVEPEVIASESLNGGIERLEESLDTLTEEGAHP